MKRIYMALALVAGLAAGANAQRHCDIKLVAAAPGNNDIINCKDSFTMGYIFINNGPDMVMTTDTMTVIDGEAAPNSSWIFFTTSNKGVGDTVIRYVGRSHKNMTQTLLNSAGTALVNAPFANGDYHYPIIFRGFTDTLVVKDMDPTNNGTTPKITINCTTGIDELLGGTPKSTLNIYPNPASSEVKIKHTLTENDHATVRVTDITGRQLMIKDFGKQTAGDKEFTLDVSLLQNGFYYVELITDNGRAISKLTIKK